MGVPSSGVPSAFAVSAKPGLEWCIYPTESDGSDSTYSSDIWQFYSNSSCLRFGGCYIQNGVQGLFHVYYYSKSSSSGGIGCRLQELP